MTRVTSCYQCLRPAICVACAWHVVPALRSFQHSWHRRKCVLHIESLECMSAKGVKEHATPSCVRVLSESNLKYDWFPYMTAIVGSSTYTCWITCFIHTRLSFCNMLLHQSSRFAQCLNYILMQHTTCIQHACARHCLSTSATSPFQSS